jgi:hypothetical protein
MSHMARVWNAVVPDKAPWKIQTDEDLMKAAEAGRKRLARLQDEIDFEADAIRNASTPEEKAAHERARANLKRQHAEELDRAEQDQGALRGAEKKRARIEKKARVAQEQTQDQHTDAEVSGAAKTAKELRKILEMLVPAYAAHVKASDAAFAAVAANPRLKNRFMPHSLKAAYSLELSRIAATRPDMNWAFPIVPPSGDQGFIQGIDNTKTPPIDALYIEMVTQVRAELEEAEKARDKDPA